MTGTIRIGNAQAFWGDDPTAAARLATQAPALDWLTLDYLAEVSMSILAKQRERDASAGYAKDFLEVVQTLVPTWKSGRKLGLITNAGGLNPRGCADACMKLLPRKMKVAVISGDDVLEQIRPTTDKTLVTANAYLGAAPVVEAINAGAELIITGRVADPSLTVAPAIAHFKWSAEDFDRIAGATVAGHLIECGTQVTGGISTDWLSLPNVENIGFPIAEISSDGSCVITKPPGTGGRVNEQTVKEQLLYEIGHPGNYLSPDATVSFLTLKIKDEGNDRVRISGASGKAPPLTYKVSATYRAGYRASGSLTIYGRDAKTKAQRAGEVVLKRVGDVRRSNVEIIGDANAAVLRIVVADERREVVENFTKQLMPLISAGPQGITGYAEGRPQVREVFGYWPTTIGREKVSPKVEILEAT